MVLCDVVDVVVVVVVVVISGTHVFLYIISCSDLISALTSKMRLSLLDSASDQLSRVYSAHRQLPTSLRDLLESCSKLTEKDVPVNILNEYCSARNDRGSVNNAMTEINSSSLHKSNAGTWKINTFTYSSMSLL
jgi:hypothetical protein